MTKLKPCPFCGGEAKQMKNKKHHVIGCNNGNKCNMLADTDLEDAITRWNTRPEENEALEQRVAELEEALREIGKGIGYEIGFTEGDAYRIATKILTKGKNNDR